MHTVITGANRGIGFALVEEFLKRGHDVTACVRDRRTGGVLEALGSKVRLATLDVTSDESCAALGKELGDRRVDVLINNAGVGSWSGIDEVTTKELLRVFDVNAIGPLRVTRALLPQLERARGKAVHVTSRMGSIGDNPSGGSYAYRMSKAALNMASTNLAADLRSRGVLSFVVHPGFVRTDMTGGSGALTPEESARRLTELVLQADASSTGKFFSHDGSSLPW